MKFKLAAAALALAVLLSLGVARATGWPNTHDESGATGRAAVQPVSARPADAVPSPAPRTTPSNDRTVPVGGTTAACAVLLAAILFRRAARRR